MKKHAIARMGISLSLGLGLTLTVVGLAASQLQVAGAAGPWFVDPGGSDASDCLSSGTACQTIGGAVGKAASGDTINIAAGTYNENVSISGKVLSLVGAGAASTIVDGSGSDRVFDTDQDVTLAALTLQNGNATGGDGGGLHATGAVTLTNVNILSSTAAFNGGAVYATGPSQISGGRFENNSGANGGAVYIANTLSLTGTQLISNTTPGWGGGARAEQAFSVSSGVFQNNHADSGGGLYADTALSLNGTRFLSNTAVNFGGGAHFDSVAILASAAFTGNTASTGGGADFNGPAQVTGGSFYSNTASTKGGGAYFNAAAALTGTTFTLNVNTNSGVGGGGAGFGYTATVNGGLFLSNTAQFAGGGAYFGQPATISGTIFQANAATANRGGGAYFNGTAALINDHFNYNQTPADRGAGAYFFKSAALTSTIFVQNLAGSRGGGAYFAAPVTMYASLFVGNSAGVHGGGAYFADAIDLFDVGFVSNSAITGNGGGLFQAGTAGGRIVNALFTDGESGAGGEEAFLGSLGTTVVLNSTVANDPSDTSPGAALFVNAGTVGVTNTLFANYAGGLIITGGVTLNGDYNLFFNAPTNAITGSHSLTGTDPLFADLSVNDFRLGPGSPAAGAGVDAGVTTDLEGNPRGNPPSIGAFELPIFSLALATDGTGSGTVTRVPSSTVYTLGQVVTLTAAADLGSTFAGWSGDASGLTNPITLTMSSNKSVTAMFALNPPQPADLTIGLHGAPSQSAPGQTVTYTLVVTNSGPGLANTVRLTDTLAAGSTFQSLSSPGGWSCATPSVGATGQIVCTNASLTVSAPASFTITVRLGGFLPPASLVTNTASVTSASADPSLPNTASATTTIFAYRNYWPFVVR